MAGHLGMTVKVLLSTIDSEELSEWMALQRIEIKEHKQAELNARAQAKEQQLRSKSRWRR